MTSKQRSYLKGLAMNIEPIFNDNDEGREMDSKPFEYIAETHKWVFR